MGKLTPLMKQYLRLKRAYKDCLLLFQMGDFYECFFEDAHILARELGITLTSREKGEDAIPMAGFPIKALDTYLPKLIEKGYKVAIADQVEDPRFAKGLVERKVVEVVTRGTLTTQELLTSKENNFVASVVSSREGYHFVLGDLLSGKLEVGSVVYDEKGVLAEIIRTHQVKEIVVSDYDEETISFLRDKGFMVPITERVSERMVEEYLKELFGERFFALGFKNLAEQFAVYLLLRYFEETKQRQRKDYTLVRYTFSDYMELDQTTLRNLDIFENSLTKRVQHSLLGVLDHTLTPMGGRLLRRFMLRPLKNKRKINKRLDDVESILEHADLKTLRERLRHIFDIERLAGLVALYKIKPKQVISLKTSLINALLLFEDLPDELKGLKKKIEKVIELIDQYILDDPASSFTEGPVIKDGVDKKLTELRKLAYEGEKVLAELLEEEQKKTKIDRLKLGFNKVFGYYLEVPKGQLNKVPSYFIRKQTLVNAERFITPKLKEIEEKMLLAQEEIVQLEAKLYKEFLEKLAGYVKDIAALSDKVAYWDVIISFAYVAQNYGYTKPEILDDRSSVEIELVDSRHPVVERFIDEFVKNTIKITKDKNFVILTGPNMGGKSTFIRQVALIQLMAQMGSYVPAQKARLKIRDKIFARVGASDDITTGRSTFMVEMSEVAYILQNATSSSLVILDEIGRGTSTHEGFALAHAICRFIKKRIKALTFCATHYHELTQLEDRYKGFINYKVDVLEEGDNVYFLYSVSRGRASKSYGVHIAKLVKLPSEVIHEAENLLFRISRGETLYSQAYAPLQLALFDKEASSFSNNKEYENIINRLKKIDINKITPLDALKLLAEIVEQINSLSSGDS